MTSRRDFLALMPGFPLYLHAGLHRSIKPWEMPEPVEDLAAAFANPPEATRPYVLWMWMGCNISKEGITRDLEAMKEAGIGGATNLFVPFYTTKPEGSGIGLVLCQQIAENHGGSLALYNRDDRTGCIAIMRLPLPKA